MFQHKLRYGLSIIATMALALVIICVWNKSEESIELYKGFVGRFSDHQIWAGVTAIAIVDHRNFPKNPLPQLNIKAMNA